VEDGNLQLDLDSIEPCSMAPMSKMMLGWARPLSSEFPRATCDVGKRNSPKSQALVSWMAKALQMPKMEKLVATNAAACLVDRG
jgi:hypothetical protein